MTEALRLDFCGQYQYWMLLVANMFLQLHGVFVCAELEATRSRLVDIELEKCELASLAQKRLEEIGNLNR